MFLFPPCHGVSLYETLTPFLFFRIFFSSPKKLGAVRAMVERGGHTNTGEVVKGKKGRTTSGDASGKSVSEKSKSMSGKCVSENSTGGKHTLPTARFGYVN